MTDAERDGGLLEVGRIDRPHGLRGDVVVSLVSNRTERRRPGARLVANDRTLVVRGARPFGRRWLFGFEDCTDREAVEGLRGALLLAEPLTDDDELWVHRLIGAEVACGAGTPRGRVDAVQANPAGDLLVLTDGALVPLRFVVSLTEADDGDRRVIVDVPDGIFELT